MRLTKPSFRLKNSDQVTFSASGKLLAQKGMSGTKISIWDIENRNLVAQHKIIPNDDRIGFLPNEQTMFVKNKNGELAFFKTISGEMISETGKNSLYGAGSNPLFQELDNLLYDGSWDGELMAWKVNPLEKEYSHTYKDHMITDMTRDNVSGRFFAVVNPKASLAQHGGSKILTFLKLTKNCKLDWVIPTEKALMDKYGNWKPIEDIDFNSTLVIAMDLAGYSEAPIVVNLDITNDKCKFTYLDSKYQSIWSVTSNDSVIITAVKTSTYRKGMTLQESEDADKCVETSHLYIHDKYTLEFIDKVFWPDSYDVSFSPDGKALAIASYEKSAYIADYR